MIHTPDGTGRAAAVPVFTDPDPLKSSLNNLRQVKGSPEAFPVRDISEAFTARLQQEFDLQRGMVQPPDEKERIYILHRFICAGGKLSQCDPCLMAHAINLQLHLCESPEERHNMLSKLSWADLVRITQRRAFTDTGNNGSADAFMAEANSTGLHLVKQVIRRSLFSSLSQLCAAYPIYSGIIPQWLPSVLLMGAGNLMEFNHAGDSAWNRATAIARAILPWLAVSHLSEIEGVQNIVRQFIDAAPEAVATAINQLRAATDETDPLLMLIFSALYLISQQNSHVPLPHSTIGRALQYLPDIYVRGDQRGTAGVGFHRGQSAGAAGDSGNEREITQRPEPYIADEEKTY